MFLAFFVKLALQTNKKNVFEEPAVSALTDSLYRSLNNNMLHWSLIYKASL